MTINNRVPVKLTFNSGSAMSMIMQHNRSSGFDIDILNTDKPSLARITTLMNGEYPAQSKSQNYTASPWEYVEVRVDWTKKYLNYTVAHNKSRIVNKKSQIPSEPLPLVFRHYSTGDSNFMQGPPTQRSEANVAWVRAFFNSSLSTKAIQKEFDARCLAETKCNVDDMTLRGSSTYSPQALVPYKEPPANAGWRLPAAILCGSATALGVLTLINVFFKRKPWKTMFNGEKRYEPAILDLGEGLTSPYVQQPLPGVVGSRPSVASHGGPKSDVNDKATMVSEQEDTVGDIDISVRRRSILRGNRNESIPASNISTKSAKNPRTSADVRRSGLFHSDFSFGSPRAREHSIPEITSYDFADTAGLDAPTPRTRQMSLFAQSRALSAAESMDPDYADELPPRDIRERQSSVFQSVVHSIVRMASVAPTVAEVPEEPLTNEHLGEENNIDIREWNTQPRHEIPTVDPPFNALQGQRRPTIAEAVPIPSIDLPLPAAKAKEQRVNYLAGLVAFACLGVTATHFCLTFVPYAGGLNEGVHYKSEVIARWFATPYIMDPIWLGPLFVTSCRFLVGGFFKKGDLKEIAIKTLLRAPRMLIPAIIVAMLEYFFLEEGLLQWLQYLPSVSWSSWPYIIDYNNFGQFISDVLELAYLIPNAAPQIVEHYCVGVLWTVPVQLQFSYTALLAAVIIRDIRNTYKRFIVYAIAIVTNWYALNWGACFWAGVLLADLQVNFQVSKKLQRTPWVWYPLAILLWAIALAMPTMSMLEDRLGIPMLTPEHNIHPEPQSGEPFGRTSLAGYPKYFEPRLNTLVFASAIQFLLETSTWFQAFFSLRFWQPIFPHAYTIYLTHGFIWWTLGSFIVVKLGSMALPYWSVLLINAVCCYSCLALVVYALSPLTEMANAAACRNIQRWATVAPVPTRATLSPFPHDLFLGRNPGGEDKADDDEEAAIPKRSSIPASASDFEDRDAKDTKDGKEPRDKRRSTLFTVEEVDSSATSTNERPGSSGASSSSVRSNAS